MGRRRQRKRERWGEARVPVELDDSRPARQANAFDPFALDPNDALPVRFRDELTTLARTAGKTCGRCREFVAGGEFGRGECIHPGSGVLLPWDDTPACDFYSGRR